MNRENFLNLRSFWQIQIIGWCCFYLFDLLESIHQFLTKRVHVDEETVPILFMFLGSCALRPFCRWLLRQSPSWIGFELRAAAASMVTSIPVACAACLILRLSYPVPWDALVTVLVWSFIILFMWCSLYFSIKQWQQSSQEKERLLRAESEVREARLLALRYQLNPHFLFNSLNAVSTLILDGNAPAATRMLAQIGDLLRTSLDSEVTAEVALAQELGLYRRVSCHRANQAGRPVKGRYGYSDGNAGCTRAEYVAPAPGRERSAIWGGAARRRRADYDQEHIECQQVSEVKLGTLVVVARAGKKKRKWNRPREHGEAPQDSLWHGF